MSRDNNGAGWTLAVAETAWLLEQLAHVLVERGLALALDGPLRYLADKCEIAVGLDTDPESLLWINSAEITAIAGAAMQLRQVAFGLRESLTDQTEQPGPKRVARNPSCAGGSRPR